MQFGNLEDVNRKEERRSVKRIFYAINWCLRWI